MSESGIMVGRHLGGGDQPKKRNSKLLTVLIATLLVWSSLAGCGAKDSDDPRGPLTVEDALLGTGQDRIDRLQRVNDLVADCMRRNGWDYVVQPARVESYNAFYDSLSVETASEWGYGITAPVTRADEFNDEFGFPSESSSQLQRDYADSLDDDAYVEYMRDLSGAAVTSAADEGSPESLDSHPHYEESCQGKAEAEVYGEVVFVERAGLEEMMAQASADVAPLLIAEGYGDEWSRCMKEFGYDFPNLGSANQYIYSQFTELVGDSPDAIDPETLAELERLESEELTIASIDVGCMESTGLLDRSKELLEESVASIFGDSGLAD